MPTKRLNVSIVDADTIKAINVLRDELEKETKKRLSLADVVKTLIINKATIDRLAAYV